MFVYPSPLSTEASAGWLGLSLFAIFQSSGMPSLSVSFGRDARVLWPATDFVRRIVMRPVRVMLDQALVGGVTDRGDRARLAQNVPVSEFSASRFNR
jgi:hypothetical protein